MKPVIIVMCEIIGCPNEALWRRVEQDGTALCEGHFQTFGGKDGVSIHNGMSRWYWLMTGKDPTDSSLKPTTG